MTVERVLTKLQRVVRIGQEAAGVSRRKRRIYDDMTQDMLGLTQAEDELVLRAIAELEGDLRFEHLDHRAADREVWRFLCDAFVDRDQDHVPPFVEAHARDPLETTCYFALEHLIIKERVDMGEVRLLPVDDPEVPSGRFEEFPPPCAGIVAVPVVGTSGKRMKERAEHLARHAIRLLRVGMRQDNQIHDRQLRFRLGSVYVLADGGEGAELPEDHAIEAALDREMRDIVQGQPLSTLPPSPTNRVEAQALVALDWFDRARRATDFVTQTLFDFFALEALLGDRSEREKGLAITFRRTMLSVAVNGRFSSPHALFFFYDQVRSGAVHGELPLQLDDGEYRIFDWNARQALNEYLKFARDLGFTRRSEVRTALETDPKAPELLEWLRSQDPRWLRYEP